jgi:AbrB family looped-hinge helix DNA binding protein
LALNANRIDGGRVETVTVSSKYQVVIPRSVRERLGIRPGQQVQVIPYGDRIEVVPVRPARELRGVLSGLKNTFERESDRL